MHSVYKYQLGISSPNRIRMPMGATPLCVRIQHGALMMWALVRTGDVPTEERTFLVFGTGHDIDTHRLYVGTVEDGPFIWHVFEV